MSWRDNLSKFGPKEVEKWSARHSGKRVDPNMYKGARYVPNIQTTSLPKEKFPTGHLYLRILPGLTANPYTNWVFTIDQYYMRDFLEVIRKSGRFSEEDLAKFDDTIHSPSTIDPESNRNNPLDALRNSLFEEGSENSRFWAKKLFTRKRHHMNVIIRSIPLLDDRDQESVEHDVGPRVFRVPDTPMKIIMDAFKDPEIGSPIDVDEAFDFRYWMERRKVPIGNSGKEIPMPQYDKCGFARKLSKAGTNAQLDEWMTNLPNLLDEYKEVSLNDLAKLADLCEMVALGKISDTHSPGIDMDRPSDEVNDDVEPANSNGTRASDDDDDDDTPRRSRRSSRDEDEDEEPRSSRRSSRDEEDEEEETPRRARRSARHDEEDEEEETPRRARRNTEPEEDEEEEEKPRRRRKAEPEEDEEEEEKPRRRRKAEPEEDEEEEPKATSKRRRVTEDDDDGDEDDWVEGRLEEMAKKKKKGE